MFKKFSRLFKIKTPLEAYLIIYALALGAVERGSIYLGNYGLIKFNKELLNL